MTGPVSQRVIAGLILSVIALVFAGVSVATPWWGVSAISAGTPTSGAATYTLDLSGLTSLAVQSGNQTVDDGPWDSMPGSPLAALHQTTRILAYLGVALALVPVVLFGLVMSGRMKQKFAGAAGLIGGIAMLPGPLYYSVSVDRAWRAHVAGIQPIDQISGFFGFSFFTGGFAATMSWGPGVGWWVMFIGGILGIIAGAVALGGGKKPSEPATVTATAPAPGTVPAPGAPPPTTAPVAIAPAPVVPFAPAGAACPFCGTAVGWVPEYGRWFCARCARYPWG